MSQYAEVFRESASLLDEDCAPNARMLPPRLRVADAGSEARIFATASPAVPLGIWRATVDAAAPGQLRVSVEGAGGVTVEAKRAAGCLLRPEAGDCVLCHAQPGEPVYVLSVLERTAGAPVLDVEGDLTIRAGGLLGFDAQDVRIGAGGGLKLEATEMSLTASTGRMRFLGLDLLAGKLSARLGHLASVASNIDSVADSLTQKLRASVREVGTEIVRAGGIRQFVRERYLLRSGRASILADEDVTVDAKQINLG